MSISVLKIARKSKALRGQYRNRCIKKADSDSDADPDIRKPFHGFEPFTCDSDTGNYSCELANRPAAALNAAETPLSESQNLLQRSLTGERHKEDYRRNYDLV